MKFSGCIQSFCVIILLVSGKVVTDLLEFDHSAYGSHWRW